jgi:hypothetical protein
MAMATSTFSPRPASLRPLRAGAKPQTHRHLHLLPFPRLRAGRRGTRLGRAAAGEAPPVEVAPPSEPEAEQPAPAAASNGSAVKAVEAPPPPAKPVEAAAAAPPVPAFRDARWVNGTWDLTKFEKGGVVDWDAVIDAGEPPIPFY